MKKPHRRPATTKRQMKAIRNNAYTGGTPTRVETLDLERAARLKLPDGRRLGHLNIDELRLVDVPNLKPIAERMIAFMEKTKERT